MKCFCGRILPRNEMAFFIAKGYCENPQIRGAVIGEWTVKQVIVADGLIENGLYEVDCEIDNKHGKSRRYFRLNRDGYLEIRFPDLSHWMPRYDADMKLYLEHIYKYIDARRRL